MPYRMIFVVLDCIFPDGAQSGAELTSLREAGASSRCLTLSTIQSDGLQLRTWEIARASQEDSRLSELQYGARHFPVLQPVGSPSPSGDYMLLLAGETLSS